MTSVSEIPAEILAGVKQVLGKHYEHGPIKLVKMNKGGEQEDRILALTQYRCYVLLYAAKTRVEHKFNHLQIDSLESDKPLKLKFGFPKEKDRDKSLSFLMKSVNDTLDVVEFILKSLQRVFPLTSMDKLIRQIRLEPPERQSHMEARLHRMSVVEQGPCGGFSQMYKFMCDYFDLPYLAEVAWDVDTIYLSQDCKEMRINDFDDLEAKHMLPIIAVLNYNTWFTHLTVVNYKLTAEALKEIPKVILSSQTLESLTLDGVGLKWDFLQDLSLSLTANSGSNLHSINLSNNPIEDRGIRHLCGPLQKMTHGLVELRLVKTGMTAEGASQLGKALAENNFIPTTLKVLDLSGNAFKDAQHGNLYNFLYQSNNITHLNFADTDCSLNHIFEALHKGCFLSLTHLNLSGTFAHSKHIAAVPRQVKNFFTSARSLKTLNMSRNRCPPTLVREILESIGFNKELQGVEIDLSSNELGQEGADAVSSCVSMLNNVTSLNLRDNRFNIAMVSLVAWMGQNHSLECIDLSQNMSTSSKKADREKVVLALEEMIQNPDLPLHTISLANNRFHLETQQLINALGSNTTLLSVDLSGNDMKDIGARLLAKALQINNKLQVVIIDNNNIGVQGFQDLAQAMERNFTLKKMPIPTTDMISSLQKNHEKTEAAIQKIQTCLQRNHSPRKFSNKQAFLLQRGFLYTTAHQMVDKLVVHIEDMATELTQKSDTELQEKISKARGLIDDANNSKRIYDILQGVVGRSDDEDLTEKLREIACLIESEMEARLEHNANGMVDGTSQLCGYVMQDRRLYDKIEDTCREHYKLPPRFVEDLVDQIGAETSNQCSEANLAMASFISDSILDEIIEQLSCVEAELSDELKKFRDEVANGTTVRVVDSIFDELKDEEEEEEDEEQEEEEEEAKNEGKAEEEGMKETEKKEPEERKSVDGASIGKAETDGGALQNGGMDEAGGEADDGASGVAKGLILPGPPPMMTKKQNIRVERHKSIKRPVSKFQPEIIVDDIVIDTDKEPKPQEKRSPSPVSSIPKPPEPNKSPRYNEKDSASKNKKDKKNVSKTVDSDFDVLTSNVVTLKQYERPRKQGKSRPPSARPGYRHDNPNSEQEVDDDIAPMFERTIVEGFEPGEKKSSVSSSPSGSQSNLSEKKSEKKAGFFGRFRRKKDDVPEKKKDDKKESKKDKKEDKKEKKEREERQRKEKEEKERKEKEEKEKSKKKEKTPAASSFTSYKSEPVIDDIDRASKVEPKSPRKDVAPSPEPVQEAVGKEKEEDKRENLGTPTKPDATEDADRLVDKPEEPHPAAAPRAALRPKTGISMFGADVMQQMQQRQKRTETPSAPKSPTTAPKPTFQSSPPPSNKASPTPLVLPSSPSKIPPSADKSPAPSPLSPKSTSPGLTSPKPAFAPPRQSPSPRPAPVPKPRKSELPIGASSVDVKSPIKEVKDEEDGADGKAEEASRSDSVKSTSSTSADTAPAEETSKESEGTPSTEPEEAKQDVTEAIVDATEAEDKPQEVAEDTHEDEKQEVPEEKPVQEEPTPDKNEDKLQNETKDVDIPNGDESESKDVESKEPKTPESAKKALLRTGSTSSEKSSPVISSSGSLKGAEKPEPVPAPKRDSTKAPSPISSPRSVKDTEKKPEPTPMPKTDSAKSSSPPTAPKSSSISGGSPTMSSKPKPAIAARPPSTRRSVVPPVTGVPNQRPSLKPVAPKKPDVKERGSRLGLANSGPKESNGETSEGLPRRPSDIKKSLKASVNGQPPQDPASSDTPAKEDGQEPGIENDVIIV